MIGKHSWQGISLVKKEEVREEGARRARRKTMAGYIIPVFFSRTLNLAYYTTQESRILVAVVGNCVSDTLHREEEKEIEAVKRTYRTHP
jgi:hypothetical protein